MKFATGGFFSYAEQAREICDYIESLRAETRLYPELYIAGIENILSKGFKVIGDE